MLADNPYGNTMNSEKSRQYRDQLANIAAGLCRYHKQPLGTSPYKGICLECGLKLRLAARRATQSHRWSPGGPGRPPHVR